MFLDNKSARRATVGVFGLLAVLGTALPAEAATTDSISTTTAVRLIREANAWSTGSSASWVDVPGATTTFFVAAAHTDVYIARFTAESACWGGGGWCSVRVLVNGIEMAPASGSDFAFDSAGSSADYESHAVDRSLRYTGGTGLLNPVTVKVQAKVSAAGLFLRLDDWHFTVQQGH